MVRDTATIGRLGLVECHNIVNVVGVTEYGPQLHSYLGGQGHEVVGKVGNLVARSRLSEHVGSLELLNHGSVVVDAPLLGLLDLTVVKDVSDGHLPLVLLNEVAESNSSLEPDEGSGEIEENVTVAFLTENTA